MDEGRGFRRAYCGTAPRRACWPASAVLAKIGLTGIPITESVRGTRVLVVVLGHASGRGWAVRAGKYDVVLVNRRGEADEIRRPGTLPLEKEDSRASRQGMVMPALYAMPRQCATCTITGCRGRISRGVSGEEPPPRACHNPVAQMRQGR